MARSYQYAAKDLMGNDVTGTLEGANEQEIVNQLRARDLFVLSVAPVQKMLKGRAAGRVKSDELVAFARQLATMVDAGLPILQSLEILRAQTEGKSFKAVLEGVIKRVEEGSTLVEALSQYQGVFGNLFIQMVGSGEAIGKLAEILTKLALYMEASSALKKKIKSAMTYPAIVTCICLGITLFLIIHVIPVFAKMYSDFGAALPRPTQFLIGLSQWTRDWIVYLAGGAAAVAVAVKYSLKTEQGRWVFDRLVLRLPIFGALLRKVTLSRFSNTLAVLLASGLPILRAMEIIKGVVNNKVFAASVQRVMEDVSQGENISEAMKTEPNFPPMMVKMIEVGEKTGKIENMLNKVAQYYDEQVSATINALTALIEPFLIVFLGAVIGGVVLCMFMPIFNLVNVVR